MADNQSEIEKYQKAFKYLLKGSVTQDSLQKYLSYASTKKHSDNERATDFVEKNYNQFQEALNSTELKKQFQKMTYKLSPKVVDELENSTDIDKVTCKNYKNEPASSKVTKATGIAKNFAPQTCGPRFKRETAKNIHVENLHDTFDRCFREESKTNSRVLIKKNHASDDDFVAENVSNSLSTDNVKDMKTLRSNGTIDQYFKTFSKKQPKQEQKSLYDSDFNFTSATEEEFNRRDSSSSVETTYDVANDFKTAREELKVQQLKRHGSSSSVQTAQKRKLGGKRAVQGKFVSPVLSNSDIKEPALASDDRLITEDDRLKNIDPKMVDLIRSEIMDNGPTIGWDDIAGLEFAKTSIQEAVVWPMLRPDIFTGLRRPPKAILLFGPPGTGKTLIGKCVASQSKSTFFSISASSLTSKWIGDGEKMVRALFTVARCYQPAVIFIDEIDSLLSQRSDSEHESSRRIKTEFLIQLDGATTDSEERLLVIGATNRPQELDEAARRRFVKRLYIPLPKLNARRQLITQLVKNEKHLLSEENVACIAELSDGYSGADLKNLCCEAALGPIRCMDFKLIETISAADVRPIDMSDFESAFQRVKSSVAEKDLEQLILWNKTYGSCNSF